MYGHINLIEFPKNSYTQFYVFCMSKHVLIKVLRAMEEKDILQIINVFELFVERK